MRKMIMSAVVIVALGSAVMANAEEAMSAVPGDSISPVKIEMRLLNDAFNNLIECQILNFPEGIEEPFHEVHQARANTDKAMEKGELLLPKNNDKIKQFAELDKQFHKKLEILIVASRKKDMKAIQDVTHKLLDSCIQCHNKFRH